MTELLVHKLRISQQNDICALMVNCSLIDPSIYVAISSLQFEPNINSRPELAPISTPAVVVRLSTNVPTWGGASTSGLVSEAPVSSTGKDLCKVYS